MHGTSHLKISFYKSNGIHFAYAPKPEDCDVETAIWSYAFKHDLPRPIFLVESSGGIKQNTQIL